MELIFYIDSLYCSIEVAAYEKGFLLFDNFLPKFDQLVTAKGQLISKAIYGLLTSPKK